MKLIIFCCVIFVGYTQVNSLKVKGCDPNPCEKGDTCAEIAGKPVCLYSPRKSKTCQTKYICSPCKNHGTCSATISGQRKCNCKPGYSGVLCEVSVCSSKPCKNGGTCRVGNNGEAKCNCTPLHTGKTCQLDRNPCDDWPCGNRGRCEKKNNRDGFKCHCYSRYIGTLCTTLRG